MSPSFLRCTHRQYCTTDPFHSIMYARVHLLDFFFRHQRCRTAFARTHAQMHVLVYIFLLATLTLTLACHHTSLLTRNCPALALRRMPSKLPPKRMNEQQRQHARQKQRPSAKPQQSDVRRRMQQQRRPPPRLKLPQKRKGSARQKKRLPSPQVQQVNAHPRVCLLN